MYQARILDKDRQLKTILPGVRWHYNRRINEATEVSVYIPRETIDAVITQDHALYGFFAPSQPFAVQAKPQRIKPNKTKYAEIAAFIQIYKGDKLKASGKIVGRTLGQVVTVEAYTEEILLEGNQTPAQYGKVWDGWDLADIARDLFDGWRGLRVKDQTQWQDRMVASGNIDLTTDPGLVMLAKRASGQYYDSGYITLAFNKSEIPHFKAWDRVRWSADSEDPVATSIQISTNGVSFSSPFDEGIPEEIGYYIGGDHDQVWVRINLSTTDTESEDANEKPTGVTPYVFALEVIARTEGKLVAGNIPSVAGVTVKGLSADYSSALQVLVQACEQVGWEFSVWNGALNIAEALGVDRSKVFVFRAGSNIEITALGDSDDELVNVLTAYGPGRGINRMEITLRDEASIAEFGEYPLAIEFDTETLDEMEQKAQEFLGEHNSPKTQFEIAVAFERGKEPEYALGDKVRVADPDTGIVTTTRIMAEAREYGESGLVVNLELGKADFTLAEAISGERKPTKPLDPLQPTGVHARGVIAGIVVGCTVPKIDWGTTECHISTASGFTPSSSTLRSSGRQNRFDIMELTPGVRYYAKLVHVDSDGRRSDPSQEVSAVATYMQPEMLPDHSLGADKFMEGLKPPIMVTSKPDFPDPRYPIDTILFYTQDSRLYRVVGNDWVPMVVTDFSELNGKLQSNQIALEAITEELIAARAITKTKIEDDSIVTPKLAAGAVVADKIGANAITANKIAAGAVTSEKIYANAVTANKIKAGAVEADKLAANAIEVGILTAGGIKADWYADIRNTMPYTGQDSLDADKPIVIPFYIPSETTKIVAAFLSAEARRYRAYSKSAPYNESGWWNKRTGTVATFGEAPVTVSLQTTNQNGTTGKRTLRHRHYEPSSAFTIMTGNVKDDESSMRDLEHDHSFSYTRANGVQLNNFNDHKHELDPSHEHDLEFGIHEDTTPASVRMRIRNGSSWSSYITLASAPSGNAAYDLISGASVPKHNNNASEMDLTSYLSGTGWKHIEFSSSRLGLIAWNVILKLDITA